MTMKTPDGPPGRHRPTVSGMLREAAAFLGSLAQPDVTAVAGPRGDGHAVLFLPAVIRADGQTARVRKFVAANGYAAFGWALGVNLGPTPRLLTGARDRLAAIAAGHGPVSLVGYSMGGLLARWLAQRRPEDVRQVVTVCAPFNDPLHSTWFSPASILGLWPGADLRGLAEEVGKPLPVPNTAVYCRSDGIVDWRCCIDNEAPEDNFEVTGYHTTMADNAQVRRILLERLARPRD